MDLYDGGAGGMFACGPWATCCVRTYQYSMNIWRFDLLLSKLLVGLAAEWIRMHGTP